VLVDLGQPSAARVSRGDRVAAGNSPWNDRERFRRGNRYTRRASTRSRAACHQDLRRLGARAGHPPGGKSARTHGRCGHTARHGSRGHGHALRGGERKVQPENITGVVINVSGLAGRVFAVAMEGKRVPLLPSIPAPPTVNLSMDPETFDCLACRRREPQAVLDTGRIYIIGNRALGESIVEQLNFMIRSCPSSSAISKRTGLQGCPHASPVSRVRAEVSIVQIDRFDSLM